METLFDYLKEKGTNPNTKDKVCIEKLNDDLTANYLKYKDVFLLAKYNLEEFYNIYSGSAEFYEKYHFFPMAIGKSDFLDKIPIIIAILAMKKNVALVPRIFLKNKCFNYLKAKELLKESSSNILIFSSGTTGLLESLKIVNEKDIINSVKKYFLQDNKIENEKFYSTISMNGIAGIIYNLFFPIITNNSVCISDNNNFFENIAITNSTMFILPHNYTDFFPLKVPALDFSEIKYIIMTGGYFNSNDVRNLKKYLWGIKDESIYYMYSSTEMSGQAIINSLATQKSMILSLPDLLKGEIKDGNVFNGIEYLSSGYVDNRFCQIIDSNNNKLDDDKLGTIKVNNLITEDLGFIHDNRLYVVGRKSLNNEKYNLSFINNYFRYHLNRDVSSGIYHDQLIIFPDIIDNYFSPFREAVFSKFGIYNSLMVNFKLKDAADYLIKYLEDTYDIEFYGSSILQKSLRNDRLEKIIFNYQRFDPFDTDEKNPNGANLFDTYYYVNYNFEKIFFAVLIKCFYINISEFNDNDYNETLDHIYEMFDYFMNNNDKFMEFVEDEKIQSVFKKIHLWLKIVCFNFSDMHAFDINNSYLKVADFKEFFDKIVKRIPDDKKVILRELYGMVHELLYSMGIAINDKDADFDTMKFLETSNIGLDYLYDKYLYLCGKKKSYHWMWRS